MSTVKYEHLPTTTLTIVTELKGEIDLTHLCYLLPITYLICNQPNYKKVPTCNVKGGIISVRYKDIMRGFPKNSRSFKNAIIIDLSMGNKNVSLKLSQKKIQLCGASSERMAIKASEIIVAYIQRIEELLIRLHKDPQKTNRTFEWMLNLTKCKKENRILLNPPQDFSLLHHEYPEDIDKTLAQWILPMISDYVEYEDFKMHLKYLKGLQSILVQGTIEMHPIQVKMKNHNYCIQFPIRRQKVFELFSSLPDWIAIYDSTWDSSVRLLYLSETKKIDYKDEDTFPFFDKEEDEDEEDEEEEGTDQYHTFTVFSTGSVTQSGPNPHEIEELYNKFNRILVENKEKIIMRTRIPINRNIKIPFFNTTELVNPPPPFQDIVTSSSLPCSLPSSLPSKE